MERLIPDVTGGDCNLIPTVAGSPRASRGVVGFGAAGGTTGQRHQPLVKSCPPGSLAGLATPFTRVLNP